MASNTAVIGLNDLPNPAQLREKRDRALALAYVQKRESKTAVSEIVEESGVNYRTVYRAIERYIDWARAELKPEDPGTDIRGA